MKKYWLILLMMFAGNTYANPTYDVTRGALQNDPSLCSYGYNPNCSSQGGYSGGYSSDDYSNAPSQPIPSYAAIAVNGNTGDWGWSTGTLTEFSAIEDAKNNCEKAGNGPCETTATQLNGCLAMASSRGKNGSWSYFLSNSGTCGSVEKEALSNCRASKAKNCCSRPRILGNITAKSENSEKYVISHFKRILTANFEKIKRPLN